MPNYSIGRDGHQRDVQRQRVYDAEGSIRGKNSKVATRLLRDGKRVRTTGNISIEACQNYVNHVTSTAWFQRRWGRVSLTVKHKVHGSATGGYHRVTLPPWARDEAVILHEIAHSLVPGNKAWHGPEFAAILLVLVRHMMGAEHAKALRAAMREQRVRVAALPKPDPNRTVVPQAKIKANVAAIKRAEREADRRQRERRDRERHAELTGWHGKVDAAETIRALVKAGHFGPAGSKPRTHALATARAIDPRR